MMRPKNGNNVYRMSKSKIHDEEQYPNHHHSHHHHHEYACYMGMVYVYITLQIMSYYKFPSKQTDTSSKC